jgi:hypothetical protein
MLETRCLLASDWQNRVLQEDVNDSGFVNLADALTVVMALRDSNPFVLPETPTAAPPWYDVDGDELGTVNDLLEIVNDLRSGIGQPALQMQVGLLRDTAPGGATNADLLTFDDSISGQVDQGLTEGARVLARVNQGPWQRLGVEQDGSFSLLGSLPQDGSADGQNTLMFVAQNFGGTVTQKELTFTLDTQTAAAARLAAGDDSGANDSDNITNTSDPTVEVDAETGALVTLFVDGVEVGAATASSLVHFPLNPLPEGMHQVLANVEDGAGNTAHVAFSAIVDTQTPEIAPIVPLEGATIHRNSRLTGNVDGTGSSGARLNYRFGDTVSHPVALSAPDSPGFDFDRLFSLTGVADGPHTLHVEATDLAGNVGSSMFNVNVAANALPLTVLGSFPFNGEDKIGLTVHPQVFFSKPIDGATLSAANFYATVGGDPLAATLVPAGNGMFAWMFFHDPMPPGTRVEVTVDGSSILAADDGSALDGDEDGIPGGVYRFSFETNSLEALEGTGLTGVVIDAGADLLPRTADDAPLAGVEVFLVGLDHDKRITDANGRFTFDAVPAGNVKVAINGLTAPAPTGVYFPEMVMDSFMHVGQVNTVMPGMEGVILPRLKSSILTMVDSSQMTMLSPDEDGAPDLSPEDRARLTIQIPPNSLVGHDGSMVASAPIGISTVPEELVRDMLPPGLLKHTFDITVQTMGVGNFSTPAPMTFPNVFNAAPGEQLNFLSFDHTTGLLVIEGTATVSADGATVTTDPGYGVTHPGWHGLTPQGGCGGSGGAPPIPVPPSPDEVIAPPMVTALTYLKGNSPATNFATQNFNAPPRNPNVPALPPIPGCQVPRHNPNVQQQPFINVTIAVDGPLNQFAKPVAGGLPLESQSFTLSAGTNINQKFGFVPKTYTEMFGANGIAAVDRDKLLGASIKITTIEQAANGVRTRTEKTFYEYRWIEAIAAEDIFDEKQGNTFQGNIAAFHPALTNKQVGMDDGFVRHKNTDYDLPAQVQTKFVDVNNVEAFDLKSPLSGRGVADWEFDPDIGVVHGNAFDIKVVDPRVGDLKVGDLIALGRAVDRTEININTAGYEAELKRVILSLRNDGANVRYTHLGGRTRNASALFTAEFNGFLPNDRQAGPDGVMFTADDTFTGGDLDAFLEGKADELLVAVRADYNPANMTVADAITILDTDDPNDGDVTMVWEDSFQAADGSFNTAGNGSPLFGFADYDANVNKLAITIQTPGRVAADGFRGVLIGGPASREWAMAHFINQSAINDGSFSVGINVNWTSPTAVLRLPPPLGTINNPVTFAEYVANTVSHEIGHTFGLKDSYRNRPVAAQNHAGCGVAPATGTNCKPNDIMRAGAANDPDLAFARANQNLLQAAMGVHADGDQPLTAALQLYQDIFFLPRSTIGVRELELDSSANAPELALLRNGQDFSLALQDDLGQVPADGFGGQLLTETYFIENAGTAALTIHSIALAEGNHGFQLLDTASITGQAIGPGSRVPFTLQFDPVTAGLANDAIIIESNAVTNDPFVLPVVARALSTAPVAQVQRVGSNNFGGLLVAGESREIAQMFEITNDGATPLEISSLILAEGGDAFSLIGVPADLANNPILLNFGESFSFGAAFDPNQLGLLRASIDIGSNDPNQPVIRVGAVGTGVEPLPYPAWGNDFIAIETPEFPASPVLYTVSDDEGNFEIFLPPETMYHLVIFDPVTGLISHGYGRTAPTGAATDLTASIVFGASLRADSDNEGLPDDIEFALGTNAARRDTDNDGLSDAAEVEQGLNPLDGVAFPTGVIGSLNLSFGPVEVLVEPALDQSGRLLAYLSTSNRGLSIVEVTNPTTPILLSDFDLSGDNQDVSLDRELGFAAVAAGNVGMHILDVNNPAQPRRLSTALFPVRHVEVFGGIAYTAESNRLRTFDLLSGAVIQTLELTDTATINGLARDGQFLYAINSGNRVHVIEAQAGMLSQRGSLQLPNFVLSEFEAGNGVLYIPNGAFVGGFLTVDVSNPDQPQLISASDVEFPNIAPQRAIAPNGSGLAVLVGTINAQNVLDVMDVSNPANTDQFITRFNLPRLPLDVAVAGGMAFVVDPFGLRVVNYLPFDNQNEPPAVSVSSPVADQAPQTPGLQVVEGSIVPIRIDATDDVQVRRVELLVDGEVVQADATFPFDFAVTAPRLMPQDDSFSIQVRATDTGGNQALSAFLTIDLLEDDTPPQVTFTNPNAGAVILNRPPVFVGFSDAMDPALLNSANVELLHLGLNGQVGGGDDVEIPVDSLNLTGGGRLLSVTPQRPIPPGPYRLTIDRTMLADLSGNLVEQSLELLFAYESSFALAPPSVIATNPAPGAQLNSAPTLLTLSVDQTLDPTFTQVSGFLLREAGADRQLGTNDDVTIALGAVALQNANTRVAVTPATLLTPGSYRFTAFSEGVVSVSQNPLDGEFTGAFPSGDNVLGGDFTFDFDILPVQVIGATPAPNAKVAPPDEVQILFAQAVNPALAAPGDFDLRAAGDDMQFNTGDDVIASFDSLAFAPDRLSLTLNVNGLLPLGTYRLTAPANRLRDASGNSLDGEFSGMFPTGNGQAGGDFMYTFDVVPPRVIAAIPLPDSRLPSIDQISLTFDRPMDDMSIPDPTFFVTGDGADDQFDTADDVIVSVPSISFDAQKTRVTLNLAGILDVDQYRVVAASAGLRDLSGVELDGEFSGVFPSGDGTAGGDFSYQFEVEQITPATVMREVAGRAMQFLRAVIHPTSGLPHNEARQSELDADGPFASDFFVPAQVGNFLAAATQSNQLRRSSVTTPFTAGYSDEELIDQLELTVGSLETILSTPGRVYEDMATGAKALYQVYDTATATPRDGAFDRIVSLLDNVQLLAGLHATVGFLVSDFPDTDPELMDRAGQLVSQINGLLSQFNVAMWLDNGVLRIGDTEDPSGGPMLDRITSEGRLAPVIGLGRGELTPLEFSANMQRMIFESKQGASLGGVEVEKLPFFGTALEAFYPTAFLGLETQSQYFRNTLRPLSEAWLEVAGAAGRPAGATGIANGFGQFVVFGASPSEGLPQQRDAMVGIPPAAGMMAGALGTTDAIANLLDSVMSLQGAGLFDSNFGVPNYQDFGSGLVDATEPVYGTLEVSQMSASLLNRLLAGGTLQFYLTRNPQMNNAMIEYFGHINSREAEFSAVGDGMEIARSAAGGDAVWHLEDVGDLVEYTVSFPFSASLQMILRYSNDDTGAGDTITVLVNGAPIGSIFTMNTGDWNVFTTSMPPLAIPMQTGLVTIGLRLDATDGFGVDLDRFRIGFFQQGGGADAEGEFDPLEVAPWDPFAGRQAPLNFDASTIFVSSRSIEAEPEEELGESNPPRGTAPFSAIASSSRAPGSQGLESGARSDDDAWSTWRHDVDDFFAHLQTPFHDLRKSSQNISR